MAADGFKPWAIAERFNLTEEEAQTIVMEVTRNKRFKRKPELRILLMKLSAEEKKEKVSKKSKPKKARPLLSLSRLVQAVNDRMHSRLVPLEERLEDLEVLEMELECQRAKLEAEQL